MGFAPIAPTGSGGILGAKKPKKPKEVKDTGHSGSYAEIVGVLSEGEIEGILQTYIDETPVTNPDNSSNFQGFFIESRTGTQNQNLLGGDADVTSETDVNQEVKNGFPITKRIINRNCDSIRIRLGVVLQEYPEKGGVLGSNVAFRIECKEGAGAWTTKFSDKITGRYSQLTEFEYQFDVSNMGGAINTFLIRVTRDTPQDTDEQRFQRQLQFQSFTEVVRTKLNYANSACARIKIDSTQFSSTPEFTFLVAGRRVAIPSNGTIVANRSINYVGTWDGTFVVPSKATVDPVWILYDLLINRRYGLGRSITERNINKYALYEISKYCNEVVPDGFGGYERRFACNVVIDGTEDAYKVIEGLRSIFRGFSYFANGAINFAADMPGTTVMQFTQADVEDGMFSYARTSLKSRHTVALVTYIDPNDFYKRAIETVEDPEGIALYGVRTLEISAFGCTSRGQARRAGLAALFTERLETETVTFKARAFAANCTPGMIIQCADARRAEIRYGGLIANYGTNYIDLDSPVIFLPGATYTVTIMLTDGSIQERTVNVGASNSDRLTVTSNWVGTPQIEGNWILSTVSVQPQLFRVLNRVTVAGSNDALFEITALEYQPGKYDAIEQGLAVKPRSIRITVPPVVSLPRNLAPGFQVFNVRGVRKYYLTATWDYPLTSTNIRDEYVTSYIVEYRRNEGDWVGTTSTVNNFIELPELPDDIYYIRVCSVDITGNVSKFVVSGAINVGAVNWDFSGVSIISGSYLVEH